MVLPSIGSRTERCGGIGPNLSGAMAVALISVAWRDGCGGNKIVGFTGVDAGKIRGDKNKKNSTKFGPSGLDCETSSIIGYQYAKYS
jgi:hypothetical protein